MFPGIRLGEPQRRGLPDSRRNGESNGQRGFPFENDGRNHHGNWFFDGPVSSGHDAVFFGAALFMAEHPSDLRPGAGVFNCLEG